MGSMLELEKTVEELKREVEVEKATNSLLFTLIIGAVDVLAANQNGREVLLKTLKSIVTPEQVEAVPVLHEAVKRAEKILLKKKS